MNLKTKLTNPPNQQVNRPDCVPSGLQIMGFHQADIIAMGFTKFCPETLYCPDS